MSPTQIGYQSADLASGQVVKFHWERSAITKRLISAVGVITLEWAMIDPQITDMIKIFWFRDHPNERIPRAFDKRSKILRSYTDSLYAHDKEEWLVFRWYLQRLREANGKRDAVAHGQPGTIQRYGRTYKGLMVPHPSKPTEYIPMTTEEIVELANTIGRLNNESHLVRSALHEANYASLAAASLGKLSRQIDGEWTHVTWENRSPKLPKQVPLPRKFLG